MTLIMQKIISRTTQFQRTYSVLKNSKKVDKKPALKAENISKEVIEYLENNQQYKSIIESLPKYLLRKFKTPEYIYLLHEESADLIVNTVKNKFSKHDLIVEVNPGVGCLTRKLLSAQTNDVYLFEASNHFTSFMKDIDIEYGDRIHHKNADFFNMAKLAFSDKMDGGSRVTDLLGDVATYTAEGRELKIFGAMQSLNFIKHLITTILLFNSSSNLLGRPDMYISMPAYNYKTLTEGANDAVQKRFRRTPALFQLLFDYKVLAKIPRIHFLPLQYANTKNTEEDEMTMYLMLIRQKEALPCHPDYLPLLWYFFRVNIAARSIRVIPYLEQWIPGCGVWLITDQDPPETNKQLGPTPNDAKLPHMTIYTQFGDLNLWQKLTVFKRFISWPEFEHSAFRSMAENDLPKLITEPALQLKDTILDQIEDEKA